LTQKTGANCGAKTSAARLAAASLPIRSMGHKRSPLQKVSQRFCGQPKSQPPRYQYLDWSKGSPTASWRDDCTDEVVDAALLEKRFAARAAARCTVGFARLAQKQGARLVARCGFLEGGCRELRAVWLGSGDDGGVGQGAGGGRTAASRPSRLNQERRPDQAHDATSSCRPYGGCDE